MCVENTGRRFPPQPPKSEISGICSFWGLWLAAVVKGVHWVWLLIHLPLDLFFSCASRTQVEGSRHNPRRAKSREFAAFGGCGWQLWLRVHWVWFLIHLPLESSKPLDVFFSCASRTQVEGSRHNPRRAKSREFAAFGRCGWQCG